MGGGAGEGWGCRAIVVPQWWPHLLQVESRKVLTGMWDSPIFNVSVVTKVGLITTPKLVFCNV